MNKILLLIILLSTLVNANTEIVNMKKGDSILLEGKNITLINLDNEDDKVVICINNVKSIVSDEKTTNEVIIDVKSVKDDYARIGFEVICDDCICDESCLNNDCFSQKECIYNTECNDFNILTKDSCINNKCVNEIIETIDLGTQDITIKSKKSSYSIPILILPITILLLIIIYLTMKRK